MEQKQWRMTSLPSSIDFTMEILTIIIIIFKSMSSSKPLVVLKADLVKTADVFILLVSLLS